MIKRLLDICLSLIGIIIVLPFFPIIALLIKLDSKGPVFFICNRVGKDMKIFKMYKFCTMIDTPIKVGESICPQYDPRVTTFGRFLRRTKLNELPQLINVLKGEMTFVGPRPEAIDLAKLYPEKAKKTFFSIKPGLVGPNQILGRNEEELYPPGVDVKKYYIEMILPPKIEIDLEYINDPSLLKDLKYIFLGFKETLVGTLNKRSIQKNLSQIYLLLADITLSLFSYLLAIITRFEGLPGGHDTVLLFKYIAAVILIRALCFFYFGLYNTLIRYISYHDILGVLKSVTLGSILLVTFSILSGYRNYYLTVFIMDWMFLILFLCSLRFGLRFYWEKRHKKNNGKGKTNKVLIFGAGDTGIQAYHYLAAEENIPFEVVGFIDDAPELYRKKLHGLKVLGNRYHVKVLTQLYKVKEIIIAISNISSDELNKIIDICQEANLKFRFFSSIIDLHTERNVILPFRSLELSDFFSLKRIRVDYDLAKSTLANKTVLITSSGGALGLELCRQILQLGCKKLIITEKYESYLTETISKLLNSSPKELVVPVLLLPDKKDSWKEVFEKYQPEIVLHTGMRKYKPSLELNENDVIWSNFRQTFSLANVVSKFGCELFVVISSLAVKNNGNFFFNALRLAEISLMQIFNGTKTRLKIARICDIVENRGGPVSIIENQIRRQENVTIPTPEAQLHLISKYSAAQFILQTIVDATGTSENGVFVCEAGLPVTLTEVTKKIANAYKMTLGVDLVIKYTNVSQNEDELTTKFEDTRFSTDAGDDSVKFLKEENNVLNFKKFNETLDSFVHCINQDSRYHDWKIDVQKLLNMMNVS